MNDRHNLARQALRTALALRQSNKIEPNHPVSIYDIVDNMGVELRFMDVPSMEGMYYRNAAKPTIVVSSLRPRGRRAFTCAHELGHHEFGHGTHVDELVSHPERMDRFTAEEYLANSFASYLLMPKAAVEWAFHKRGWTPSTATPAQIYTVAGWLDVGYESLIHQMSLTLKLLGAQTRDSLLRTPPKAIRATILGAQLDGELLIADKFWLHRTIDIEVGDFILLPSGVEVTGSCVHVLRADEDSTLVSGTKPGRDHAISGDSDWAAYIRVSRRGYVGRSIFRHLEESEDEE
jgi:Zn-dependent peptidase ImmA (M78 family)